MNKEKVYKKIASLVVAIENCRQSNNEEWLEKHSDHLTDIVKNNLPSGSGIDSGCSIDLDNSSGDKIIIVSSYHVMSDLGCYDGWIDFTVTVRPSLQFDYTLMIQGKFGKNQDIKDYLYDVFSHCLEQIVK